MNKTFNYWYEKNYAQLSGSGIWLRGGELNTCDPKGFESSGFKILISRLSTYRDTSDSITHKILFQIARNIVDTYVDLAFLPPPRDGMLLSRDNIPWLLGTSSKRDALQFDVLAISNSVVQELINLPIMLQRSNIALSKKVRMERNDIPLIILGGANALNTSMLIGDDPLVDGIFAGEDACLIEDLFKKCQGLKTNSSKYEILEELNSIPGFFQPDQKRETVKHSAAILSRKNLLLNAPVFYEEKQPGRGKFQISEGCSSFCSFCSESWGRKPYREFTSKELVEHATVMKSSMGLEAVELYSFNFNMYGEFYSLLWNLHSVFSSVGLKSQRFDFIADNFELIRIIHAAGKSSITCGLEGISSRLRAYLHKSLSERNIRSAINVLLRAPLRELKIFLIATGLENENDFNEFKTFLNYINEMMISAGRKPRIIFSLTPLVRFPFTPLESEVASALSVYKNVIKQIERLVKCRGFEFRVSCELPEYAISQLIARAADPVVLEVLMEVCEKTGFIYYQEVSEKFLDDFKQMIEEKGLSFDKLLSTGGWDQNSRVPVRTAVDPLFLSQKKEDCTEFRDSGYCMGTVQDEGTCRGCQACPDDLTRQKITGLRESSPFTSEMLKDRIKKNASDSVSFCFEVYIPFERRGISRKIIGMALARAIMLQDVRLAEGYRDFGSSEMEKRFVWPWVSGLDHIWLNWSLSAAENLKEKLNDPIFMRKINEVLAGWCRVNRQIDYPRDSAFKFLIKSEFTFDGSLWLKSHSMKYTVQKNSSGDHCYLFNSQSMKKKILMDLVEIRGNDVLNILKVIPGEKFNLFDFLKHCFKIPTEDDIVRIDVECNNI